jgi:hypothetical protein
MTTVLPSPDVVNRQFTQDDGEEKAIPRVREGEGGGSWRGGDGQSQRYGHEGEEVDVFVSNDVGGNGPIEF